MTRRVVATLKAAPVVPEPRHRQAPLGVGFGCVLAVPEALYTTDLIDFVEVTPEIFHREALTGGRLQLVPDEYAYDAGRRRCGDLPVVMHGVELSIGSAHGMYEPCLGMMDRLRHEWPFLWYSEHLHFQTALDRNGIEINTGVPLPLPATAEAATLVAVAVLDLLGAVGDEFGLMNRITALSGCGQLLDLHNLYCNAVNFGFDASRTLQRIALDRVTEIHVAGGSWSDGFYMDGHDGRVPEPVWDLLEQTLSLAPRVAGVVFELLEMFLPRFGPDRIARELERARGIWRRCHRATELAA
jgi:hypothetical protein